MEISEIYLEQQLLIKYYVIKHLPGTTAFDKVLRDKTFSIAKRLNYDGYQREPTSMVYNFLIKSIEIH